MDFKIVFIDDNMSEKEPFVQNIRKHYEDADCNHVFQNPDKGLEYVLERYLRSECSLAHVFYGNKSAKYRGNHSYRTHRAIPVQAGCYRLADKCCL